MQDCEADVDSDNGTMKGEAKKPARYFAEKANWAHVGLALVLAILCVCAHAYVNAGMAKWLVRIVNAELVFLIVLASFRADSYAWADCLLPHRLPGLLAFMLMTGVVVTSFAVIYQTSDIKNGNSSLVKLCPQEAMYFSVVTIATVGYGDYLPSKNAQPMVEWEIGSGFLLLIVGFPLLLSRIASWEDQAP